MVRDPLENLMRGERAMYFETHLTCANGYYTRDLLTLARLQENLKVPHVREGDRRPNILPYCRRTSLELRRPSSLFMPNGITLAVERNVMRGH